MQRRRNTEKEREENIFFADIKENEKGKNIWKNIFCGGEERQRRKRRKVFLEG